MYCHQSLLCGACPLLASKSPFPEVTVFQTPRSHLTANDASLDEESHWDENGGNPFRETPLSPKDPSVITSRFAEASAKLFFDPGLVPKDTFTGPSAVLKKLPMYFMPDFHDFHCSLWKEVFGNCFPKNLGKLHLAIYYLGKGNRHEIN